MEIKRGSLNIWRTYSDSLVRLDLPAIRKRLLAFNQTFWRLTSFTGVRKRLLAFN
ncbi:hypothetical protein HNO89_000629 [Sporosarcina luteola]|nr:hypothetical protein [Sporosarcina luteola]